MTYLLNLAFECVLEPNHKINVLKNTLKKNGARAKCVYDLATGKEQYAFEAYGKAQYWANKKVEEIFKGVKAPW